MGTESRKLAAVLFADMVGFSALRQAEALELRDEMMALAAERFSTHRGRLVEWRLLPTLHATNFCIAVPQGGPVSWSLCDANHSWLTNLGCQFPADYMAVNAWQDTVDGDFLVRLRVQVAVPQTNCPVQYKIVVPALDTTAHAAGQVTPLIAPYDYYMVDATLDVAIEVPK